ncbi:hypothetical protein AB0L41_47885 [Amycolatopsis mediterranei]|uniref:hypothetical protein n=1 Tax=Amycolatopsis mediterranei TaxID=33910 RepID=UPI00342F99B1
MEGGSCRTTTALVLGSVFGHHENYRTLGRRPEVPDPDRTVRRLPAERDRCPGCGSVNRGGPAGYLRRQTSGCDLSAGDRVPLASRDYAWVRSRLRPHFDLIVVHTAFGRKFTR